MTVYFSNVIINIIVNPFVNESIYSDGQQFHQYEQLFLNSNKNSSNPAHGELQSMQHYVKKFVGGLRQVGGFLQVLWSPAPI